MLIAIPRNPHPDQNSRPKLQIRCPGWSPPFPLLIEAVCAVMNVLTKNWLRPTNAREKTTFEAVQQQVAAMGVRLFEVGLYKGDAGATETPMIPRLWDAE